MLKTLGIILLIGAALIVFNRDKIEAYKQKIIETVNPAAKEKRLLSELENNLDQLANILNSSSAKAGSGSEKLSLSDQKKLDTAVAKTKSALQELKENNQKTDLVSNLSNLIQKIVPFESAPSPTWLPTGQECK